MYMHGGYDAVFQVARIVQLFEEQYFVPITWVLESGPFVVKTVVVTTPDSSFFLNWG